MPPRRGYLWFWRRPSLRLASTLFKASGAYLLLLFAAALAALGSG